MHAPDSRPREGQRDGGSPRGAQIRTPEIFTCQKEHIFPADVHYRGKDCWESKKTANNFKFSFLYFLFFCFLLAGGQYTFSLKSVGVKVGDSLPQLTCYSY